MTADPRFADAPDRRNPAIARAVVFGVVAAVTWWFWVSSASADEAVDAADAADATATVEAGDVAAAAPAGFDVVEAVEAVVAPVTPEAPAAPVAPGAPALPDVLSTARTTVDQAVDATLTQAVAPVLTPIVDSVVTPVVTPVVQAVTTPVYQAVVEDLLPAPTTSPNLSVSEIAAAVEAPVPPVPPSAPAATDDGLAAGAGQQVASTRSTADIAAPHAFEAPALPTGIAAGATQDLPSRSASQLPLSAGAPAPSPLQSGVGGRDVPDRAQGDMADAVAHVRAAASDMRALLVPKVVGASVNAGSRPAVTPD